ncbi:acyl-CoA thioesterase [Psychromicrobium xiongbiense]|uniref:acyl-CoA thioesterase n=1 Tax=Psychromicrobium xiongbiense TaxID=3051184 RepID=UPI002554AE8F|nr:thioesterase family protein [Psychromicrobium sp. YIM S02556]
MSVGPLILKVPLRWGDMDAYGHINNVEIVRILEEARVHAFGPPAGTGRPGVPVDLPVFNDLPDGVQTLVVEHRIKYLQPLNYRNVPVEVQLWVSGLKGASLTLAYAIVDPVENVRCVVAETALAFFDEPAGRLVRLNPEHRRRLEPLLGPSPFSSR